MLSSQSKQRSISNSITLIESAINAFFKSNMTATLFSLPAELKLNIFEQLPAKEVQHLRRVSKELHAFVDGYASKISLTICKREQKRVTDFADTYIFYDKSLSFVEKLARWVYLRGVWLNDDTHDSSMLLFAHHVDPEGIEISTVRAGQISNLASTIVDLELRHHHDRREIMRVGKRLFLRYAARAQSMDLFGRKEIARMYNEVVSSNGPGGRLGAVINDFGISDEQSGNVLRAADHWRLIEKSQWLLTSWKYDDYYESQDTKHLKHGIYRMASFSQRFGLPQLPRSHIFAYVSEYESTMRQAHWIMSGDKSAESFKHLMKASVLEGIIIV